MSNKVLPQPRSRVMASYILKEHIDNGWINVEAPYQREIVWDDNKKSELIDSILNNYYIPPLVFAIRKIRNRNTRIVIDGKQRLTAIQRFMTNEIPYTDKSSGEDVKIYYNQELDEEDHDEPRMYLDEEAMDKFNRFEFVCIEYSGITEDDEFDIFSRVQLGVAITSAEKLKAHNTPIAKLCRQLALENSNLSKILPKKGAANLFQAITHMMLTIKEEPTNFQGHIRALQKYIAGADEPKDDLVDSTKRALHTITALIADDTYCQIFSRRNELLCPLKMLELLLFTKFIASVQRTRTLKHYAEDFIALREYLIEKKDGRLYMGKEAFNIGMEFIDDRLSNLNLTRAPEPLIYGVDSSDDELKMDEYEPDTAPIPVVSSSPPSQHAGKKRRTTGKIDQPAGGAPRSALAGRPTAKRGGKSQGFSRNK